MFHYMAFHVKYVKFKFLPYEKFTTPPLLPALQHYLGR